LGRYLLVAFVALVAFGATLGGSFHFDDYALFSDPAVVSPSGWLDLFRPAQTRPFTYLTLWLNYQTGGQDPAGYHAVNLALHTCSALILLWVARRLVDARTALFATLLFAAHPILTEAVAYVYARSTLLMTLFCLLSLAAWTRGRHWVAVACFGVALLGKEECVAWPAFLLLFDWSRGADRRGWRAIAAMIALAAAAGARVLYAVSVTPGTGAGTQAGVTPLAYLAVQGAVILRYLRQLVAPWGFSVDPQIGPYALWVELLCWAAIVAGVTLATRWFRNLGPGLWFLAGIVLLLPSSSVLPAADLAADRRMYLPLVAFAIGGAMLLRNLCWEAFALVIGAFLAISLHYSLVWRTENSLWTEAVAQAPRKVRPRIQLARTLDQPHALAALEEARRIAPENPDVASEEGRVYLSAGMPAQALSAFGQALSLAPNDAEALQNRGAALLALGQREPARRDFDEALKRNPCLFEARLNLLRMGVKTEAPDNCRFTPSQKSDLAGSR